MRHEDDDNLHLLIRQLLTTGFILYYVIAGRGYQTRARLLTPKVSAPRPMNLPSLRREHAGMEPTTPVVLGTVAGWGSPSSSPASATSPGKSADNRVKPQSPVATADTNAAAAQLRSPSTSVRMLQRENGAISPGISNSGLSQGSPKVSNRSPQAQTQPVARAWAVPTTVVPTSIDNSSDFPTAAETLDHTKGTIINRQLYGFGL